MRSPAGLSFEAISCLRGNRLLFEDLSFALGPGAALMIRGPNGAGKSSLLRIAGGLLAPAAGRVVRSGDMAFTSEAAALDERLPLADALHFWARIDGRGRNDVDRGLEAMGLGPLDQVPVRMLSTGQRRRAALARVIAGKAAIWLLDEPANGLDTASLDRLAAAMTAHRAEGGIVLAASHQPLGLDDPQELAL
ncbi:heme ABC exporter ATP-binding protein CcmA [Sphingomonas oleivorans]|uniref:Heme ABC exporter ATP-binding protein CcmA n=1 Tax=Sphingomonas oleivorans TaxID=1735121 RepID=A0A2T5FXG0_9SPHN|nr:heme ABC exporter ATP-binding protein CcmA [Sphingomonas oleivorans]PTQ10820.1 heme ABC exporter ATP-binding protein CcmA [Sphingomonas oleivorans]